MAIVAGLWLAGCAAPPARLDPAEARRQVMAAERAFAKTMADRDHGAFATFVADDTVFFSGPKPLHGKQAVVDFWARFYKDRDAPFSWEPEEVEVLDSGTLAISSGPVRNPQGKVFARFTSIWRLEAPGGRWRVVFDKGAPECDCAKP
jgi:ketosteroid isomerase-like protein